MIIHEKEENALYYAFCIDPRFRKRHNTFLDEHCGDAEYLDDVRCPGGAADLESLRKSLAIGVTYHNVTRVVLTVHENCLAGAERADLFDAARVARELGVADITLIYFKLDGSYETVLED